MTGWRGWSGTCFCRAGHQARPRRRTACATGRQARTRQVLLRGRAEDIRTLDLDEVEALLEDLDLPPHLYSLWKVFLEHRHAT